MKRLFLCCAALLFASLACEIRGPGLAPIPQASPVSYQVRTAQASPELNQHKSTPSASAAPTKDLDATATVLAKQQKDFDDQRFAVTAENNRHIQTISLITQQAFNTSTAFQVAILTAQPGEQKKQADIARAKEADAQKAKSEAEKAKSDAEAEQARLLTSRAELEIQKEQTGRLLLLMISIVVVCACLLLLHVTRQRTLQYESAVEAAKIPPAQPTKIIVQKSPTALDYNTNPPGDPGAFTQVADWALAGGLLGVNTIESNKIGKRPEYSLVYAWMAEKQYLAPAKVVGGGIGLSDAGKQFCAAWLETHPLPTGELPQNNAVEPHTHDIHVNDDGGGAGNG